MIRFRTLLAATSLVILPGIAIATPASIRNVVLVHGAFADGSGWQPVADILRKDGYTVSVVQEPETSLEDDVTATTRILDRQSGPTVLVGHSYGGADFAPDEGEPLGKLASSTPSAATSIAPTADGYLMIDPSKFPTDFAPDLPLSQARFMAISQVPINSKIFGTPITSPAWKTKPSYAVVATDDRMINPDLERSMYARAHAKVTEIKASHVVFISQPKAVAAVIEQAARSSK